MRTDQTFEGPFTVIHTMFSRLRSIASAATITLAAVVFTTACEAQEPSEAADGGYEEIVYGDPAAPVTIIEYASLTCGHCGDFHTNTLPELKKEYLDTGKAKLVFRDFPTNDLALVAAMLPRCAPESNRTRLLSVLFKNQEQWLARDADREALIKGYARLAGLSGDDVDACLSNQPLLTKMQEVFSEASNVYDVEATPTFFVGETRISGNRPIDEFRKAIDAAFVEASKSD